MGRRQQELNAQPCYLEEPDPNILEIITFLNINKMKEKMSNVAYSYSTKLVSSNLKLPYHSHIKTPGSPSLQ